MATPVWEPNPIAVLLAGQGHLVLDGGLATTLESYGHDLDDDLWSARVLVDEPEAIRRAHREFLAAGADCITTSSYQASFQGFDSRGLNEAQADALLRLSSDLAVEARDVFWEDAARRTGRCKPLVAGSVGPYGAYLADGSEYSGDYGASDEDLYAFHAPRWRVLVDTPVDLLACETIPSLQEARVLLGLLAETSVWAWLSFSCRDSTHLSDGSLLAEAAAECDDAPGVAAVGINCTSPRHIPGLIGELGRATDKPILVYPNSGERYETRDRSWHSEPEPLDWEQAATEWAGLGANGIGGCCRVGAREIATVRRGLASPNR